MRLVNSVKPLKDNQSAKSSKHSGKDSPSSTFDIKPQQTVSTKTPSVFDAILHQNSKTPLSTSTNLSGANESSSTLTCDHTPDTTLSNNDAASSSQTLVSTIFDNNQSSVTSFRQLKSQEHHPKGNCELKKQTLTSSIFNSKNPFQTGFMSQNDRKLGDEQMKQFGSFGQKEAKSSSREIKSLDYNNHRVFHERNNDIIPSDLNQAFCDGASSSSGDLKSLKSSLNDLSLSEQSQIANRSDFAEYSSFDARNWLQSNSSLNKYHFGMRNSSQLESGRKSNNLNHGFCVIDDGSSSKSSLQSLQSGDTQFKNQTFDATQIPEKWIQEESQRLDRLSKLKNTDLPTLKLSVNDGPYFIQSSWVSDQKRKYTITSLSGKFMQNEDFGPLLKILTQKLQGILDGQVITEVFVCEGFPTIQHLTDKQEAFSIKNQMQKAELQEEEKQFFRDFRFSTSNHSQDNQNQHATFMSEEKNQSSAVGKGESDSLIASTSRNITSQRKIFRDSQNANRQFEEFQKNQPLKSSQDSAEKTLIQNHSIKKNNREN
eukprot:403357584